MRLPHIHTLKILVGLLFVAMLGACSDSPTSPNNTPDLAKAELFGSVTVIGQNAPIQAALHVGDASSDAEGRVEPLTITTDEQGNYRVSDLAPGTYNVVIDPPVGHQVMYLSGGHKQVTLEPGKKVRLDFELAPAGESEIATLSFFARDASGTPVSDVFIFAWESIALDPADTTGTPDPNENSGITGTDGRATILVEPGTYWIDAHREGYITERIAPQLVTIEAGDFEDIEIHLQEGDDDDPPPPVGDVLVCAEDNTSPVPGVYVWFTRNHGHDGSTGGSPPDTSDSESYLFVTLDDGKAYVYLPDGDYDVSAQAPWGYDIVSVTPDQVTVDAGRGDEHGGLDSTATRTVVNIELAEQKDPPLGKARVLVTGDEEPLEGAVVQLWGTGPNNPWDFFEPTLTDENGVAEFEGPPGVYAVYVYHDDGWFFPFDVELTVEIVEDETSELRVNLMRDPKTLPPNLRVSATLDGEGISNVRVQFTTSSDTATGLFRYDLYTDSKGEGLIHLPKGEYEITGEAPWPYEIVSIEPTTLEITDAEIFHGVAIELRERDDLPLGDAVITVLLDDEPFAGVAVLLFGDNLADSTHTGATNEDGVVRFRVPEGPYFVFVESPDGQFFPEDEPLIHVIAGETVEITLNFSSRGTGGGETNVTVSTVAGNEGVPCVEVRFFPVGSPTEDTPLHDLPNGDIWNGYVLITDGEGMGFIDLPPGEYEVEGMDRPGYRVISVDPASFEIAEGDSIDVLVEMEKLDDGVGIINVIDSEKNPIPGVLVTLFPEAGDLAFEGETNNEGVLTLELPAATYYVEIPPPPGFYYPTDEVVTITIEPNKTSEITLVFEPIDANAPGYLTVFSLVETFDEAIEVDIEITQGDVIVTSAALTMENGWNYTGEFSPGEYRVTARAPEGYSVLNDDVLRDDLGDEAFIDIQVSPQGHSTVFFVVFPQAETDSD